MWGVLVKPMLLQRGRGKEMVRNVASESGTAWAGSFSEDPGS